MDRPSKPVSSLLEALQRRFQERRGSVRRTEEALGISPGYFRVQRNRKKGVSLLALLKALGFTHAHPREFFLGAFHSRDPIRDLRRETSSLGAEPPHLVTEVLRRGDKPAIPPRSTTRFIQELDCLRYVNTRLARNQASASLQHTPRSLLPRLLGAYASALRLLEDHDGAQHALTAGLELAAQRDDFSAVADLWQRMAYIVADRGNYQRALVISERAERIHVRIGDDIGVGKALTDQGIWLYYLDRHRESIDSHLAALHRLANQSLARRCRVGSLQFLGLNYLKLQKLDRAQAYAARARQEASELGPWVFGGILWLQADIAMVQGRYEEAEGFLREAIEIFSPISAGQTALASIELVRSLILQNRTEEAYETAKAMARLVEPLRRKSRVAEAALAELVRCGLERRGLTLRRLDDVAEKIATRRRQRLVRTRC